MAEDAKYMTEEEKKDKQYERLIAARNFHYDNLNKWLTFFYVAIGAIFTGYCTLHNDTALGLIILGVGYVVGLAGYLSCKGYYYWENNWIMLLQDFERKNQNKDQRVYSVFANVKGLDKPWCLVNGANVSTTKVALLLTFIIACTFGAILSYNVMPFNKVCCNVVFSIIASAFSTWIIAWFGVKAMPSIKKIDDLKLPVD